MLKVIHAVSYRAIKTSVRKFEAHVFQPPIGYRKCLLGSEDKFQPRKLINSLLPIRYRALERVWRVLVFTVYSVVKTYISKTKLAKGRLQI